MNAQAEETKKRIEECALKEFLEKGFNGASLRRIVKHAGVTTGAFYKYYPSKEALFEGLAGPCVNHIYEMFDRNYENFVAQDLTGQTQNMESNSRDLVEQVVEYSYQHHEIMQLVLTASEGTRYADFVHNLAKREEESTIRFAQLMRDSGMDVPDLDRQFVHMISSGMFSSVFEIILHNMDREEASMRMKMLMKFYTAGWEEMLGVEFL